MKPLPKSMRENYRYLAVKIDAEIDRDKASNLFREALKAYAGEKGLIRADPKLIDSESDYSNSEVVVRINREAEDVFRAAIVLSEIKMYTIRVSGSSSSV